MAKYVVGDIQGCFKGLKDLLKKVSFDPANDKLYAVGDLIARGPDSLKTIEFLIDLGESFETVLGNHDLHLIAIAHGIRKDKTQDKLSKLITSKKFSSIIDWLLTKPLAIKAAKKTLITHAGLHPEFSIKQALSLSAQIEEKLQSKDPSKFLRLMYGNQPDQWSESLSGEERHRFIVNTMTRMRYLDEGLRLEFSTKCHPDFAPTNLKPWYSIPNKHLSPKHRIIFGHWASLNGIFTDQVKSKAKVIGLDTGYVWGNHMTLLNLDDNKIIQTSA